MHFFIDHSNLPVQNPANYHHFGPDVTTDGTKRFNVTSRFPLTSQAKAFACQKGIMVVQQSTDSNLVNVVLKPIEALDIPFQPVRFYVYRGLQKSDFFDASGTAIKPKTDPKKSDFISRFWTVWKTYSDAHPGTPDPTPECLGYGGTATTLIEEIFGNNAGDLQGILVKEGEHIGSFAPGKEIGFEVVLETGNFRADLGYLRAAKSQIDVSALTGLALRAEREKVLSFVDPAAFFGLHFYEGVKIFGESKTQRFDDLFNKVISKFATKNRVYLDIRSEQGRSYNFYQNYGGAGSNTIGIGQDTQTPTTKNPYGYFGWPIMVWDLSAVTPDTVSSFVVQLRVDDNTKPALFYHTVKLLTNKRWIHHAWLLKKANFDRTVFLSEGQLLDGTAKDWSQFIKLKYPNNRNPKTPNGTPKEGVAYYIKLHYFRQEQNAALPVPPPAVPKNASYFDAAFCPIDLPGLPKNATDKGHWLQQVQNPETTFVRGALPTNANVPFGYAAKSGAVWDDTRVVFYVQSIAVQKRTGKFFKKVPDEVKRAPGFALEGDYSKFSFVARDIKLSVKALNIAPVPLSPDEVKILDVSNTNHVPTDEEGFLALGITRKELEDLQNLSGFSPHHPRQIFIEELPGPALKDANGTAYHKFKLKVQGWDSNGASVIKDPAQGISALDILVYSGDACRVFASKKFAAQEVAQASLSYSRNYEEQVGIDNTETTSNDTYEEFFVKKNSVVSGKVTDFQQKLNGISKAGSQPKKDIQTEVEKFAKAIFDEAVKTAQAQTNANPDDRPLYWARNKMLVALKSHDYFLGQFDEFSVVQKDSDLAEMVRIFEEKSRNYTGASFASAPSGEKKILLIGFDPYSLNSKAKPGHNIKQSNPASCAALALHGKSIGSGSNKAFVQAMILPMRYADFDGSTDKAKGQGEGIVEKHIKPLLTKADYIITLGYGDSAGKYTVDKYATAARGGSLDNLGYERKWPLFYARAIKISDKPEMEWLETALPANFYTNNSPWALHTSYVDKIGKAEDDATTAPAANPKTLMRKGSGGNYLPNEAFYRIAKLRSDEKATLAMGHLRIEKLQDELLLEDFKLAETNAAIAKVKAAIENGIK